VLVELRLGEQRYRAVLEVLDGVTVTGGPPVPGHPPDGYAGLRRFGGGRFG
jgi:hypothetical protein